MEDSGVKRDGRGTPSSETEDIQESESSADMNPPTSYRPRATSPSCNVCVEVNPARPPRFPLTPIPSTDQDSRIQELSDDDDETQSDPYTPVSKENTLETPSVIAHMLPRSMTGIQPRHCLQEDPTAMQKYVIDKIQGLLISKNPTLLTSTPNLQRKLLANVCRNWTAKTFGHRLYIDCGAKSSPRTDKDSGLGSSPPLSRATTLVLDGFITEAVDAECKQEPESTTPFPDDTEYGVTGLVRPAPFLQSTPCYDSVILLDGETRDQDTNESRVTSSRTGIKSESEEDDDQSMDGESDEEMSLLADDVVLSPTNPYCEYSENEVVDMLLHVYAEYTSHGDGATAGGMGRSTATSQPSTRERTSNPRKRQRDDESGKDQDGYQGDGDPHRDKRQKRPAQSGQTKRFWACPFAKAFPDQCSECNTRILRVIGHVKQHLFRGHSITIRCDRCQQPFQTGGELRAHLLSENRCTPQEATQPTTMTIDQSRRVNVPVPRSMDAEAQWYWIFEKLFSDIPNISRPFSPYLEDDSMARFATAMDQDGVPLMWRALRQLGVSTQNFEERHIREIVAQTMPVVLRRVSQQPPQSTSATTMTTARGTSTTGREEAEAEALEEAPMREVESRTQLSALQGDQDDGGQKRQGFATQAGFQDLGRLRDDFTHDFNGLPMYTHDPFVQAGLLDSPGFPPHPHHSFSYGANEDEEDNLRDGSGFGQ